MERDVLILLVASRDEKGYTLWYFVMGILSWVERDRFTLLPQGWI